VLLPVPAESGPILNAPLAAAPLPLEELWAALWPGQLVVGGRFGEESAARALAGKIALADLLRRPAFVTGNAALTAEAAAGLLLRESERALQGSRVLILGFGRIGTLLAAKLRGLGAHVTVAARKEADRALAEALGHAAMDFAALEGAAGDFDAIVNTVPARVLSDAALCCLAPDTLLLELASAPGGFDRQLAANIGLHAIAAPGLPGRCKALAAAELMQRELRQIIREQED
jgi:dipicolinate synthase subunit A